MGVAVGQSLAPQTEPPRPQSRSCAEIRFCCGRWCGTGPLLARVSVLRCRALRRQSRGRQQHARGHGPRHASAPRRGAAAGITRGHRGADRIADSHRRETDDSRREVLARYSEAGSRRAASRAPKRSSHEGSIYGDDEVIGGASSCPATITARRIAAPRSRSARTKLAARRHRSHVQFGTLTPSERRLMRPQTVSKSGAMMRPQQQDSRFGYSLSRALRCLFSFKGNTREPTSK